MVYDEIFERPIEEYSDDEIRETALALRANAKLTKGKRKASATAKTTANHSIKKDKAASMLEQAMTQARLAKEAKENNPT